MRKQTNPGFGISARLERGTDSFLWEETVILNSKKLLNTVVFKLPEVTGLFQITTSTTEPLPLVPQAKRADIETIDPV